MGTIIVATSGAYGVEAACAWLPHTHTVHSLMCYSAFASTSYVIIKFFITNPCIHKLYGTKKTTIPHAHTHLHKCMYPQTQYAVSQPSSSQSADDVSTASEAMPTVAKSCEANF